MKLKILLPAKVLLEEEVEKVTAEAENGFFTILPRHVDFVSALVPSIFTFVPSGGSERYLALDEGILVKQGDQLYVSAARAVQGESLEVLQETVESELKVLGENEKKSRAVMSRLEVDTLRRFSRLGGER